MKLSTVLAPIMREAKAMIDGDTLRRTHYTQVMGGSQWKTLVGYMVEAQDGVCAVCGRDGMRRARIDQPDSLTAHLLIPSAYWASDMAKRATTANNGKSLDPYRFGFVEGNVVAAHSACSRMVKSEVASQSLLAIDVASILTVWTAEMKRAAKVVKPVAQDTTRRMLQARGWMAED